MILVWLYRLSPSVLGAQEAARRVHQDLRRHRRHGGGALSRHFNVAISLSLAGIGFERTTVEIWVDPTIPGAIHQVDLKGDEINLTMTSRNFPSENPRTSRIVTPSIIAALRGMVQPVVVGS
jgi:aspartate dehydrogenase